MLTPNTIFSPKPDLGTAYSLHAQGLFETVSLDTVTKQTARL